MLTLVHSYISSLEEQQVTLLGALRELNRRAPDDQAVRETILQLERRGFEINSLKYDDPTRVHVLHPSKSSSESAIPEAAPWVNSEFTIDDLELFLELVRVGIGDGAVVGKGENMCCANGRGVDGTTVRLEVVVDKEEEEEEDGVGEYERGV